jgi:hypothetical protein
MRCVILRLSYTSCDLCFFEGFVFVGRGFILRRSLYSVCTLLIQVWTTLQRRGQRNRLAMSGGQFHPNEARRRTILTNLPHRHRLLEELSLLFFFPLGVPFSMVLLMSPGRPPALPSMAATSSAVRNLPPGPRGLRMAWLCLDSCRYGLRPLDVRRSASSSF